LSKLYVLVRKCFLGCTYAREECEDDNVVKCVSKSEVKSCCQYVNNEKCNNENYLDVEDIYEIYRGCFWRDALDKNKCESFKCSDYKNEKDCIDTEDKKNVKEDCEWVRVDCTEGITAETKGRCVSKGSLNNCCYYNETNCWEATIKVGGISKGCYYNEGECLDFTCNKYVGEESCRDNIFNVNGGCFLNGEALSVCDNIYEITDCEDIKDRTNCRGTKEEGHIFTKLLGVKKCEWVKVNDLEKCVNSEDVTDCGGYSNSDDCSGGWIFDKNGIEIGISLIIFIFIYLYIFFYRMFL
jgi:hypothetical protein